MGTVLRDKGIRSHDALIIDQNGDFHITSGFSAGKLEEMEKKILNGRIKNPDAEKIRLEYIKAYINGCNCFKSITDNGNAGTIYDTDIIKEYLNTSVEMLDIEPDDDDYLE